jgi:glycosyltransferase involved in cell wall biosynthesis
VDLVRRGETGFLVQSAEEWMDAVGRLLRGPELRRRMGRAGRQRVVNDFSLKRGGDCWLEVLTGRLERRGAA